MTKQESEQCEALLTWAKALDAAAEAAQARINATLAPNRADVGEEPKSGRREPAAACF